MSNDAPLREYQTEVLCPVCFARMDLLKHPAPEINDYVAALLAQPARTAHFNVSPKCREHPAAIEGWILKPLLGGEVGTKEAHV